MRLNRYYYLVVVGLLGSTQLVASTTVVDWSQLKNDCNDLSAEIIAENWPERPQDFFIGVSGKLWKKIIPLLSIESMKRIKGKEFENNLTACQAFASHIQELSDIDSLPESFRLAVYNFLVENNDGTETGRIRVDSKNWIKGGGLRAMAAMSIVVKSSNSIDLHDLTKNNNPRIVDIVRTIPTTWVTQDALIIMNKLGLSSSGPLIRFLNDDSLITLLENPKDSCKLITLSLLKSFTPKQLAFMTPSCMASIEGLKSMDLSTVIGYLPDDSFSKYNGSLSRKTIEKLSGLQLKFYGLNFNDPKKFICDSLELHHTSPSSFTMVTRLCLYGYLSKRWPVGLGIRWGNLADAGAILHEFTPEMQTCWANIHPSDFALLPRGILRKIFSVPYAYEKLDLVYFSREMMKEVFAPCLFSILSRPYPKIALEQRWRAIPIEVIQSFISNERMVKALSKVSVSDFLYMKPPILEVILKSKMALENLPQPTDHIILSFEPNFLSFTPDQFESIIKAAPNLAGQLLMLMERLPEDIFADCDGDTLRALTFIVPNQEKLDWKSLFSNLEGKKKSFSWTVKSMGSNNNNNGERHLCATIKDLTEYLTLPWLGRNMNEACRKAIRFDKSDISVLLMARELVRERLPWEAMLEKYTLENWRLVFAEREFTISLGRICEFWAILSEKYQNILMSINPKAFKRIQPECITGLNNFLKSKGKFIPLLAGEAFATHRVNQLPCKLDKLSPRQIKNLSRFNVLDFNNPTLQEINQHALHGVTLNELMSLKPEQFLAVLEFQWTFVHGDIKTVVSLGQFQAALTWINTFTRYWEKGQIPTPKLGQLDRKRSAKTLLSALKLYTMLLPDGCQVNSQLNFAAIVLFTKSVALHDRLINIILNSTLPRVMLVGLARDAEELGEFFKITIPKADTGSSPPIELPYSQKTGFDRKFIIDFLNSRPETFAKSKFQIFYTGGIGAEGLTRILVSQLLKDIQRDIIVQGGGKGEGERERESKGEIDNGSKFVWGISGQVGFLVGLVFGKVIQLDMRLLFSLHKAFFSLLINPTDQMIEDYYKANYQGEMSEFIRNVKNLSNSDPLPPPNQSLCNVVPKIESIRFTRLSTRDHRDEAQYDMMAKTNIWGGLGQGEGFERVEDFKKDDDLLTRYSKDLWGRTLLEFKIFIKELIRGLEYSLPLVKEFKLMSTKALSPFVKLLPRILNVKPISATELLERVSFCEDRKVESLVKGQTILASKVFSAFIHSLDREQIRQFLAVWSGTFAPSLDRFDFTVDFRSPTKTGIIKLDFCEPNLLTDATEERPTFVIAPGEQYQKFFAKVVAKLFGPDSTIKPDCEIGGFGIYLPKVEVCTMSLTIFLQSAQGLINSLVDAINIPLTFIVN